MTLESAIDLAVVEGQGVVLGLGAQVGEAQLRPRVGTRRRDAPLARQQLAVVLRVVGRGYVLPLQRRHQLHYII